MKRNIGDNETVVTYYFRGLLVMSFNIKERQAFQIHSDASLCGFIPEDLNLICEFTEACRKYQSGEIDRSGLFHVEVN